MREKETIAKKMDINYMRKPNADLSGIMITG